MGSPFSYVQYHFLQIKVWVGASILQDITADSFFTFDNMWP